VLKRAPDHESRGSAACRSLRVVQLLRVPLAACVRSIMFSVVHIDGCGCATARSPVQQMGAKACAEAAQKHGVLTSRRKNSKES